MFFGEEIGDDQSSVFSPPNSSRNENQAQKAFRRYKQWVRQNQSLLFSAESLLSQLTWLAPNRFSESELQIESLHTILGLIQWWHGILVTDYAGKAHFCPLLLGAVRQVEGLIELIAINRCEQGTCKSKYPILTKLEIIKFTLKIFSLIGLKYSQKFTKNDDFNSIQSSRVLVDDGMPKDASTQPIPWLNVQAIQGYTAAKAFENFYQNNKRNKFKLSSPTKNTTESYRKLIGITDIMERYSLYTTQSIPTPKQMNYELIGDYLILLSEIIHLSRPIAYLILIRHYGVRSWKPWIASLSMDVLSRILRNISTRCYSKSKVRNCGHVSNVLVQKLRKQIWCLEELQEFNRRDAQMLLYLLRSPCFDLLTRNVIEMSGKIGGSLPLLGGLVEKILEILVGIQKYYTYTSAS